MTVEEKFEQIPFRGRYLDSNYRAYCRCCDQDFRLWYGSANEENRKKMTSGKLLGQSVTCPPCKMKRKGSDSAYIYRKLTVDESINTLFLMSSNNIDYDAVEQQASYQHRMDREVEEMEEKSKWYLEKMQKSV